MPRPRRCLVMTLPAARSVRPSVNATERIRERNIRLKAARREAELQRGVVRHERQYPGLRVNCDVGRTLSGGKGPAGWGGSRPRHAAATVLKGDELPGDGHVAAQIVDG